MALNVTTQHYKTGLDTSVLKEVSQEILRRAAEKNNYSNTQSVNTMFRAVDMGLDLYNGKVDNNVARQIAMNNSGLQIQLSQNALQSIAFLNSQAAQSATNVQKAVEGKMTVAVNEAPAEVKVKETPKFNSIISLAANKDKRGSHPFYNGELLMGGNAKKENNQSQEKTNIFA